MHPSLQFFVDNGFPAAVNIYDPNRTKSQHKNKNPHKNPVKIGNFDGKNDDGANKNGRNIFAPLYMCRYGFKI
jgi:hypothetical protein